MYNAFVQYKIECENNLCTANIKLSGKDNEIFDVDEDYVKEIEYIINRNKVYEWNNFNRD